jgi:hypothetical protein
MLQLSKNKAVNKVAVLPEAPVSASATDVRLDLSQDYDRSSFQVYGTIISDVNNTSWLIIDASGSFFPVETPTGLYTVNIFAGNFDFAVWEQTAERWDTINTTWQNAGTLLSSSFVVETRAFVSGSDVPVFTQYESPDENGAYTTYLG